MMSLLCGKRFDCLSVQPNSLSEDSGLVGSSFLEIKDMAASVSTTVSSEENLAIRANGEGGRVKTRREWGKQPLRKKFSSL